MADGLEDIISQTQEEGREAEKLLRLQRALADAYERSAKAKEKLDAAENRGGGSSTPGSLVPSAKTTGSAASPFGPAPKAPVSPSGGGIPFGGIAGTAGVIAGVTAVAQQVIHAMHEHETARKNLANTHLKLAEEGFNLAKEKQFDGSDQSTAELMERRAFINSPVDTGGAIASYLSGDRRTQRQLEHRAMTYDAIRHERQRKGGQLNSENALLSASDMKEAMNSNEVQFKHSFRGMWGATDGTATGLAKATWQWFFENTAGRISGTRNEAIEADALELAERRVKAMRVSGDRYEKGLTEQPWYKTEMHNRALFAGALERDRMMAKNDWNRD